MSASWTTPTSRRRPLRFLLRWLFILAVWSGLALGALVLWCASDLPRPETALDAQRRPGLTLLDRDGRVFASFGDVVGESLRLTDLPATLPAAAVSVEDRRFWSHPGLDPIGIARAAWVNATSGRLVQGGSTITQQVAKTLFLSNARTVRRKVQEVLLTLWLERAFSKTEILEIWLNRVYLGSGAWGVDAAARLYFGVSARKVNLWQSALLAGLPRAPSRFSPRVDPDRAIARAKEVLTAMVETGAITQAQAQDATARMRLSPTAATAGWFADWATEQAAALLPPGADAAVRTTLDPRLQALAETRLAAMLDGPGATASVAQGAIIVLDAATGAVRAMVGGRDYRTSPFKPRRVRAPAAGLGVQAVRLARRRRARHGRRRHRHGRAVADRRLESGELRPSVPRPDHPGRRTGRECQHRRGTPHAVGRRPARVGGGRTPPRH